MFPELITELNIFCFFTAAFIFPGCAWWTGDSVIHSIKRYIHSASKQGRGQGLPAASWQYLISGRVPLASKQATATSLQHAPAPTMHKSNKDQRNTQWRKGSPCIGGCNHYTSFCTRGVLPTKTLLVMVVNCTQHLTVLDQWGSPGQHPFRLSILGSKAQWSNLDIQGKPPPHSGPESPLRRNIYFSCNQFNFGYLIEHLYGKKCVLYIWAYFKISLKVSLFYST